MVGGGRPILREILGQPTPCWSEIADFKPIIARSSSAVGVKSPIVDLFSLVAPQP